MAGFKSTAKNHAEHFLTELNPNTRNALRHLLLSESGVIDLRIALGISRVRVVSVNDERTACACQGNTVSLFDKHVRHAARKVTQ
jgi:hypothetical protein